MHSISPIIFLVLAANYLQAQSLHFTSAAPQPDILEIYAPASVSGDIDGDGDSDLFQSGIAPRPESGLFRNDGNGNFQEIEGTTFPRATSTAAILEDLDDDGDLDLFYSGNGVGIQEFTHVYLNNGQGGFNLSENPGLPPFADSGVNMADIDQDGDPDLLLVGKGAGGVFIADVFLNDGNGIFTPSGNGDFTPVQFGRVAFLDVENDEDIDVIISGEEENGTSSTTVYLNDGVGNFTAQANTALLQLTAADVDAADIDNDGDIDVLISGATQDFSIRTTLYLNDGAGQFSELSTANLQQTFAGTNVMEDLDNDGDLDILITGSQNGGLPNIYNIAYENLGGNSFAPADTLGGEYISGCVVDDFNGDGLLDIIIQGFVHQTTVYWNTSTLTSLEEVGEIPGLTMYPNPSNGRINIKNTREIPDLNLAIFASDGRLVYKQKEIPEVSSILRHNLPAGTYIVQFNTGTSTLTKKLVVVE